MRLVIIGAVLMLLIAGGAIVWVNDQGGEAPDMATYTLIVELVAAVQNKASTQGTGNPTIGTSKMVAVKVTLQFKSEDAMNAARGDMKRLRRAYGKTIGSYLSNREKTATDDIEAVIRAHVAPVTGELFAPGVVTTFDVEGQFAEQVVN
jgi:hypothetical protein